MLPHQLRVQKGKESNWRQLFRFSDERDDKYRKKSEGEGVVNATDIREILCQVIKWVFHLQNFICNRSKLIGNLHLKSSLFRYSIDLNIKIPRKYTQNRTHIIYYNGIPMHFLKIFAFYNRSKIMQDFNLQISSSLTSFFGNNVKLFQFFSQVPSFCKLLHSTYSLSLSFALPLSFCFALHHRTYSTAWARTHSLKKA